MLVLSLLMQCKYLLALNLCFSGFVPLLCLYLCNKSIYWLWICFFQFFFYPCSVYTYATEVFIGFKFEFFRLCTHVLAILMQQKYLLALNLCFSGFVPMVCLYLCNRSLLALNLCFSGFVPMVCLYLCNRSIYWLWICVFQALYPWSVYTYATEVFIGFELVFFRLCTHVLSIFMQQKYFLASNLSFWACSRRPAGSLFINEEQKRVGSWCHVHSCDTCWPWPWHCRHRPPDRLKHDKWFS